MTLPIGRTRPRLIELPNPNRLPERRAATQRQSPAFAEYNGRSGWQLQPSTRPGMPELRGDLAPGGRYDPTRVGDELPGSQRLFATSTWGFPSYTRSRHHYAVLSDPLPRGTTWAQANDALQRFNAPTRDAWRGVPGDGRATRQTVVEPSTGLPAGVVTVERGDGWVRNTTTSAHALIGSITRRIVRDDQGRYRILTEGEGRGGPAGGIRHRLNIEGIPGVVAGGPELFSRMDEITLRYLRQQRR